MTDNDKVHCEGIRRPRLMPPQQAIHRGYVPHSRSATSTLSVPPPHLGTFRPLASDCSASHPSRTSTFVVPTDPWSAENASQNCVTCPSISLGGGRASWVTCGVIPDRHRHKLAHSCYARCGTAGTDGTAGIARAGSLSRTPRMLVVGTSTDRPTLGRYRRYRQYQPVSNGHC